MKRKQVVRGNKLSKELHYAVTYSSVSCFGDRTRYVHMQFATEAQAKAEAELARQAGYRAVKVEYWKTGRNGH